ncbi:2,4-dienoyl-CoA reductase [Modicisalibacter muralis]|uniref:2,4-dienoyl-CoA reductase n=1 Tax=Modicisalibacter muralis TaxID=119000 RepID=A0A1G9I4C6_9GAMM|nr:NADH:flavin oxidoreductase/NADH oxidase [Halomonas muralis]SDL20097.1 2,4-dienoyl-CoA reductase [Halomonas muralis]
MSTPTLFTPLRLGSLELDNRIVIAPMCQYSAEEGCATDWHLIHLGHLAFSGAGLLILEATAVSPEGRISPADLGLWSDANEQALKRVLTAVRRYSPIPLGIQLGHAGRKASSRAPWQGGGQVPIEEGGWQALAPSAIAHGDDDRPPSALTREQLDQVRDDFVAAARRAERLGLELIELHGAHGYLLHEFLSPLSNQRDDEYGGSLENRLRFPLEVFEAVRDAFPADKPVGMRVSGSDWAAGGWDLEQTLALAQALDSRGCSFLHLSGGGLTPKQSVPLGPNYQVPFARAVKAAVAMPIIAVGLITEPEQAEAIIGTGDADAIALARAMLYDPRWPWHAAAQLGASVHAPNQYLRSQPRQFKALFKSE